MNKIAITTKREYLTWRNRWKRDYKYISEKIREQKVALRAPTNFIRSEDMAELATLRFIATDLLRVREIIIAERTIAFQKEYKQQQINLSQKEANVLLAERKRVAREEYAKEHPPFSNGQ